MSRKTIASVLAGFGIIAVSANFAIAHCGRCAGDAAVMVKSMDDGKVTLVKAADAAAVACKGKITDIIATIGADKKVTFKAYCAADGKLTEVTIDTAGKAATPTEVKSAMGADASAAGSRVKAMDDAKLTLAKSVEAGEAASKGKALAATTSMKDGKFNTDVYALAGDKLMRTEVDATGKAGKTEEAKMLPEAKTEAKPKAKGG